MSKEVEEGEMMKWLSRVADAILENLVAILVTLSIAVPLGVMVVEAFERPTATQLGKQLEEVTDERDELKEEVNRLEERVSMLNDELDDAHGELTDYNDLEVFSMDALQVFAGDIVGRLDDAKDYIADNDLDGAIYSIDVAIEDAEALLEYGE